MTSDEWRMLSTSIGGSWPGSRWDEVTAISYYRALRSYDAGWVSAALARLATSSERLPSIAAVVASIGVIRADAETRSLPPRPYGSITFREWILSGTGQYLDGSANRILPSAAVKIAHGFFDATRFTPTELADADARAVANGWVV